MKRYILLCLVAIAATSCWDESNYVSPKPTYYASQLLPEVEHSLATTNGIMQLAVALDAWMSETDPAKKFELECLYFSHYKLFVDNNGVVTIDYDPYSSASIMKVFTGGASIYDDGSLWEFKIDQEQVAIINMGENQWSMQSDKFFDVTKIDMMFSLVSKKINCVTFYVDGSAESNTYRLADNDEGVEYNITETVKCASDFDSSFYFEPGRSRTNCLDGKIEYILPEIKGSQSATVEYLAENHYKITYRDFTDEYGGNYSEYYW